MTGGDDCAVAGQGQPEGFAEAVHGVCREHARTGAAGRTGLLFQFVKSFLIELSDLHSADSFKDGDQVAGGSVGELSGFHRAAGSEDGRDVDAHSAHQHAGNDLVAVRNADHGVERMGGRHGFDAVGNEFAAGEREFHARMPHRDAVADCDCIEFEGNAARLADLVADVFPDLVEMTVSGNDRGIGVAYADERLGKITLFQTRGPEQCPVRSLLHSAFHDVTSHFFPFKYGFDG